MTQNTQTLSYLDIKATASRWAAEYDLYEDDTWTHPYSNVEMSITQVLWSLYTERYMSLEGMKLHFDRYGRTIEQKRAFEAEQVQVAESETLLEQPKAKSGKATKTRKATANLVERKYIAATNTVLYTFQSSRSEYQYFITSRDGAIDTATHLDCIGYKQHGHCCHMDMVIKTETPLLQAHKAADEATFVKMSPEAYSTFFDVCGLDLL